MSPTATAPVARMDPRIGRRRAAVARARRRRRRRAVWAGSAVLVLAIGALVVLHSPLLAARHVTVLGASHTGRAAVLRVAGLSGAPPLVDVDPADAAARIEALPWVAQATVSRAWPDRVVVRIVERVPVAVVREASGAGTVLLVDATGRVLAGVAPAPAGLPVLSGVPRAGGPGSQLGPAARAGLLVAAAADGELPGRVQGVAVARDGAVTLDLGGGVRATLGQATSVDAKLAALASVLAGAAPSGPESIDVSVPGEPTVAPGGSTAA